MLVVHGGEAEDDVEHDLEGVAPARPHHVLRLEQGALAHAQPHACWGGRWGEVGVEHAQPDACLGGEAGGEGGEGGAFFVVFLCFIGVGVVAYLDKTW